MRIVVVEDEMRARKGIVSLISKIAPSHKVVGEAENGVSGIEIIKKTKPDLVIVDIRMPQMDGLEMLEKINDLGIKHRTVILSGYGEFEYARKAIKIGVDEYLLKPITVDDLEKVLNTINNKIENERSNKISNYNEEIFLGEEDKKVHSLVINRALQIIRENIYKEITLEEIAMKLGITPEYLSTLFYREVGVKFTTYIRDMRLNKAKELLINSDYKVCEIANFVGYPNEKYFNRVFKKALGITPLEFKKLNR
ncbi:response regulator transcription factor [Thermoanaerobacterium thermosaccharolyticum]|jgi:two-component system response regulator YesN|uniref:response regulator transcription factor n=1 Tax=Thermoanaerobacterium thermosaccharolyticum TaxID=1517 RepID=UPI003D2A5C9E